MIAILRLSARNLMRYRRRTLLTAILIAVGVVALLLFLATAGSFKQVMISGITDSMLGHLQIHHKGYTASIDNLPLNLDLKPNAVDKIDAILKQDKAIASYSKRVKFGAMFSNFTESTSIRLNGIDPVAEDQTVPDLRKRISEGDAKGILVQPGEILIPALLAKGMKVKVGDTVVLVATNAVGSVNGKNFTVKGVLEAVTGPGGRDGYIHIDDARELLQLEQPDIMEIAVRLQTPDQLMQVSDRINQQLDTIINKENKPVAELHTWQALSPFANIVKMIDMLTLFIRIMLIAIVLVSVLNVMLMAVYERIREIGTLSAIGTQPNTILGMFLGEGLLLGLTGAFAGIIISLLCLGLLQIVPLQFAFGREMITLHPMLSISDLMWVLFSAILVSVLASLQPAWRASRMDPIKALHHV